MDNCLCMRVLGRQKIDSQACSHRTLLENIYSEITLKMPKERRLRHGLIRISGLPKSLRYNLHDNGYALN
jgi:hypothetical protein